MQTVDTLPALRARCGFPGLVTLRDRGQTRLHAHALGGREIGTVLIEKVRAAGDDALLGPAPANFLAHVSYRQSVLQLPPDAQALTHSTHDP